LNSISGNCSKDIKKAKFFEMANVYISEKLPPEELPQEKEKLTLGMYGSADFYDLKGAVEEILSSLGLPSEKIRFNAVKNNTMLHSGRAANVVINGIEAGFIGELHLIAAKNYEMPERVYIAVLDVDVLINNACMIRQFTQLPKYPAAVRDIAIVVREDLENADIEDKIREAAGAVLEELEPFDVYKGQQVPAGMKSIAYSLAFRMPDRTFKDDEVNMLMAKILGLLKISFNAELRY
jgi:phenylalanyl-tRNA synthetase beta chain